MTATAIAAPAVDVATDKHPKGLYVLFATEMWERFSFYSMLALFTLYLRDQKEGFGWTAAEATGLYSNYLMFVYASPLVGGWIADKKIGYRKAVMVGGIFFMAGHLLLSIPSIIAVYVALTCLVVGNGFFKPNVSTMVGNLYPDGSHLKDRAYNIFYMGINIGAATAPLVMEIVRQQFGFHPAFAVAAFGMAISVFILWKFKKDVQDADRPQGGHKKPEAKSDEDKSEMDRVPERNRIAALIVIFAIVIVFWMVFHQNGSTLTYWADDNTDWRVSGVISNMINPFFVVTLTFPLVFFWKMLDHRGLEPSTPTKMAIGMTLTGLSFFILYFGASLGESAPVTEAQFAAGNYRITDRGLDKMKAAGVPDDVTSLLRDPKLISVKHSSKTVKDLREGGIAEDSLARLSTATGKNVADEKMTFTGHELFSHNVQEIIGAQAFAQHKTLILQTSYLFKVSPMWLVFAYGVVTLGELMLSPMGLALVSKVAPYRLRGVMMGGWFVATAIGNKLTAIGVYWEKWNQSSFFAVLGLMALVMAVVLFSLLKPLKKAMPGV